MASAPPPASGPRYSTSALETKCVRGLRRAGERALETETVSEAHDLYSRFSQEKCAVIVHAPGLLHIGGSRNVVHAYTPNFRRPTPRHIHVHRRTTVGAPSVADTMLEPFSCTQKYGGLSDHRTLVPALTTLGGILV